MRKINISCASDSKIIVYSVRLQLATVSCICYSGQLWVRYTDPQNPVSRGGDLNA